MRQQQNLMNFESEVWNAVRCIWLLNKSTERCLNWKPKLPRAPPQTKNRNTLFPLQYFPFQQTQLTPSRNNHHAIVNINRKHLLGAQLSAPISRHNEFLSKQGADNLPYWP